MVCPVPGPRSIAEKAAFQAGWGGTGLAHAFMVDVCCAANASSSSSFSSYQLGYARNPCVCGVLKASKLTVLCVVGFDESSKTRTHAKPRVFPEGSIISIILVYVLEKPWHAKHFACVRKHHLRLPAPTLVLLSQAVARTSRSVVLAQF